MDGVRVIAVATRGVVNARSVLRVTPAAFAATTRTWYRVFARRPEIREVSVRVAVPAPAEIGAVVDP